MKKENFEKLFEPEDEERSQEEVKEEESDDGGFDSDDDVPLSELKNNIINQAIIKNNIINYINVFICVDMFMNTYMNYRFM